MKRQRKSLRPNAGTEAQLSYLFIAVAGGFAMTLVRNEAQWHSAALKRAGQSPIGLLPLDGVDSAVPSLQLHPVFGAVSSQVPPGDTMSCFVSFGDKSWGSLKYFFQTQDFDFLFLSQRAQRGALGGSIALKTPISKLNRPLACKPPAAIVSELTRVAIASFAKATGHRSSPSAEK